MTLKEWQDKTGAFVGEHQGRKYIPDILPLSSHRSQLWWALSDYTVETVTGGTIWLRPRPCPPSCEESHEHREGA